MLFRNSLMKVRNREWERGRDGREEREGREGRVLIIIGLSQWERRKRCTDGISHEKSLCYCEKTNSLPNIIQFLFVRRAKFDPISIMLIVV